MFYAVSQQFRGNPLLAPGRIRTHSAAEIHLWSANITSEAGRRLAATVAPGLCQVRTRDQLVEQIDLN